MKDYEGIRGDIVESNREEDKIVSDLIDCVRFVDNQCELGYQECALTRFHPDCRNRKNGQTECLMDKRDEIRDGIKTYTNCPNALLEYLDSMGVVIKAQGYFPEKDAGKDNIQYCAGWYDCFHKAIDTGYVATERLIKESNARNPDGSEYIVGSSGTGKGE